MHHLQDPVPGQLKQQCSLRNPEPLVFVVGWIVGLRATPFGCTLLSGAFYIDQVLVPPDGEYFDGTTVERWQ